MAFIGRSSIYDRELMGIETFLARIQCADFNLDLETCAVAGMGSLLQSYHSHVNDVMIPLG